MALTLDDIGLELSLEFGLRLINTRGTGSLPTRLASSSFTTENIILQLSQTKKAQQHQSLLDPLNVKVLRRVHGH